MELMTTMTTILFGRPLPPPKEHNVSQCRMPNHSVNHGSPLNSSLKHDTVHFGSQNMRSGETSSNAPSSQKRANRVGSQSGSEQGSRSGSEDYTPQVQQVQQTPPQPTTSNTPNNNDEEEIKLNPLQQVIFWLVAPFLGAHGGAGSHGF